MKPAYAASVAQTKQIKRAGSSVRIGLGSESHANLMSDAKKASDILRKHGVDSSFKIDKVQYRRDDVISIIFQLGKKIDDTEHKVEVEKQRSRKITNEKGDFERRISGLLSQI